MSTNFPISKAKLLYAAKALRRSILNTRGQDFKQELHNRLDQSFFDKPSHENIKQAVYLSKMNWGNVNWQQQDKEQLNVANNIIAACDFYEGDMMNVSINDFQLLHKFLR